MYFSLGADSESLNSRTERAASNDLLDSGVFGADFPGDPDDGTDNLAEKRALDTLSNDMVDKRYYGGYFDNLASGLVGKRYDGYYGGYLDNLASGIVGKRADDKRMYMMDNLASGLLGKRYYTLDNLASGLVGKRRLPFDTLASSLVGKRGFWTRYGYRMGSMASKRRPFDNLASSLIGKRSEWKKKTTFK